MITVNYDVMENQPLRNGPLDINNMPRVNERINRLNFCTDILGKKKDTKSLPLNIFRFKSSNTKSELHNKRFEPNVSHKWDVDAYLSLLFWTAVGSAAFVAVVAALGSAVDR